MAIPSPGYWHVSSVGWTAVSAWAATTAYTVGQMVRQLAGVAVGGERVFICIVAGTSLGAEPTWATTKGAKTAEAAGPTWQECTGQAFGNGNLRDTSAWTLGPTGGTGVKGQAVALGYVIKRDNAASYQICTTAGTAGAGAEPAFSDTAGVTTNDNTVVWTSLGVVGNFTTAYGNPSATVEFTFLATWGAAGDVFYIADNHSQTRAATLSLSSPGTSASPCFHYCVDRTVVSPGTGDLKTTAVIATTGANVMNFGGGGFFYWYGTIFQCGTGAVNSAFTVNPAKAVFEACSLQKLGTTANTAAIAAGATSDITFINTSLGFGNVGDSHAIGARFQWLRTSNPISGATIPTTLLSTATNSGISRIDGVDLSIITGTLVGLGARVRVDTLIRCKVAGAVTLFATPTSSIQQVDVIQCDSGATNYIQARGWAQATLTNETTIVRGGGASDGTTPISWKVVSTTSNKWLMPFECFPIAIWNDTVSGNVTATVEIVASGVLNNDDVWLEVEYMGSALTPVASFANNTKANNLATGAALTASSATWASSPGSPQKLSVTFAPKMKGDVVIRVYVGKASQTVYIDPDPTLT